jgi:hypothetical protein
MWIIIVIIYITFHEPNDIEEYIDTDNSFPF